MTDRSPDAVWHANGARLRLQELPARVAELAAADGPKPQPEPIGAPAGTPLRNLHLTAITGKMSGRTNRLFYAVVLGVSLTGAGMAAAGWLDWWAPFAFAAVGAVELGGVALSVHADERRRLGERALMARLLSGAVAVGAVAVNWFGHADHVGQAAFFAGMSALGYLVWLIDSSARRRDWLRAEGMLDAPTPVYGLVQWLRHPDLTRRAKQLALADPALGRQGSLTAAREQVRTEKRRAAIAAALRDEMAEGDLATNTYDPDKIAQRLEETADYDRLTEIIQARLAPERVAPPPAGVADVPAWRRALLPADAAVVDPAEVPAEVPLAPPTGTSAPRPTGSRVRKVAGSRRRKSAPEVKPRRTAEETRKLASELAAAEPELTQAQIAARLQISDRQLRNVLNPSTTPKEA